MAVTYELLETYNGDRLLTITDPEDADQTIEKLFAVGDIKVRFTSDDSPPVVTDQLVDICSDENGAYDHEATLIRVAQVGDGL